MFINGYRQEVQDAFDTLLEANNPPEKEELEKCASGDLTDFYHNYFDYDDGPFDGWWTRAHRDFYNACERLKRAEDKEYKRAMQWVPA